MGLVAEGKSVRAEIVQLRANAVLSVLLFHLKVPGFQGGFVGVDVFFVISGYLITRNILREAADNRFSFGAFYLRRTRRIYPALIFTVLATYSVGVLWCAPAMLLDIAKECTHALLSIANVQYWREASRYFAAKSDELSLLHCWSLSLEEQFYLVWPALLIAAHRMGVVRAVVLVVSLASFVAAIAVGPIDRSAVFFLTPFRIFEFGCGALVLFMAPPRPGILRELAAVAGLASIAAGVFFLRPELAHNELLVLVVCIGAAAVIWAGDQTTASRALNFPGLLGIGAISYSLYLCHWPIIFYARFIFGDAADTALGKLALLVCMLLVAVGMYFLIERRFTLVGPAPSKPWRAVARYSVVSLSIVALTHLTFLSKGLAWRMPQSVLAEERLESPAGLRSVEWPGNPATIDIVGDSHASMYAPGLLPLVQSTGGNLEYLGEAGCPILSGVSIRARRRADCLLTRNRAVEALNAKSRPLIFVQLWEMYDDAYLDYDRPGTWSGEVGSFSKLEDALYQTLTSLTQSRPVLLIGAQVPAGCEINRARLLQGPLPHVRPHPCPPSGREAAEKDGGTVNAMLARVQARLRGRVELVRPYDYLCTETCPTYHDGHWLYWDRTHFTLAGSQYMVERAKLPLQRFILNGSKVSGGRTEN